MMLFLSFWLELDGDLESFGPTKFKVEDQAARPQGAELAGRDHGADFHWKCGDIPSGLREEPIDATTKVAAGFPSTRLVARCRVRAARTPQHGHSTAPMETGRYEITK